MNIKSDSDNYNLSSKGLITDYIKPENIKKVKDPMVRDHLMGMLQSQKYKQNFNELDYPNGNVLIIGNAK